MAFNYSPKIVKNGLILYLDAANKKSYPGTGASWFDLSGNERHATLINSPTFNSNNGGAIVFSDTSFQHATFPTPGDLNTWTVESYFKATKSLTNKVTSLITGEYDLSTKLNVSLGTNAAPTNYDLQVGFFNGAWRTTTSGQTITTDIWYFASGTYDGTTIRLYINGIQYSSTNYTGTPQSGGNYRIARRWDESATSSGNFFDGQISITKLYNRALTASEITQNYYAHKSRFNLS